jgi:aminoglycoside phosphotransferase (APT) family kinase protein
MNERGAGPVPGRLIGAGRSADVYDAGNGRVLRRYRDGRPAAWVAREAEVMKHARAHRVPVPEVFDVSGPDIVMARAAGPTMVDVLIRRPWTVGAQARLLARLHDQVHAVPALDWLPAPFGDGAESGAGDGGPGGGGAGDGGAAGDGGRGEDAAPDGAVLLHRDLHPMNVILTADGPQIIDWEGAARGPAVADVAMTWVIVAFSQVPVPRLEAAATRTLQAMFTRAFLRAAGPVDQRWRQAAVRHRLGDPHLLPAERARLERLVRQGRGGRAATAGSGGER